MLKRPLFDNIDTYKNNFKGFQMLVKTKNLFPHASIKNTMTVKDAIIIDFPKKLKILKSFKMQFSTLGFIVNNNQIVESKKPIISIINSQINNNDISFFSDRNYNNSRNLILNYFKNPEKLNSSSHVFPLFLAAFDTVYNTGSSQSAKSHTTLINRLFRKNKGRSMYLRIEELLKV